MQPVSQTLHNDVEITSLSNESAGFGGSVSFELLGFHDTMGFITKVDELVGSDHEEQEGRKGTSNQFTNNDETTIRDVVETFSHRQSHCNGRIESTTADSTDRYGTSHDRQTNGH